MNRPIATIILFLFLIIPIDYAVNNLSASSKSNKTSSVTKSELKNASSSTLYAPEELGLRSATLSRIDSIVKDGISKKVYPGCQVLVMKDGKKVYDKSFGYLTYEPIQKVQPTTMYDLASLTKTTGTLLAVMKLYDNGKIKLTDKASQYLTFLRSTDKENITIKDLLFHETGLPGSLPFERLVIEKNNTAPFLTSVNNAMHSIPLKNPKYKYKEDWVSKIPTPDFTLQVSDSFYLSQRVHNAAMKMIADTRLGPKTYLYSCINFILLKEIVETISGMPMDVLLNKEYYTPMNLQDMTYLPLRSHKKDEIAPTLQRDYLRPGIIQGYVHDPAAAFLGGISGNAGLFADSEDVAKVYQMMLNNGELDGRRYLSEETCLLFTTTTSASGRRGLGFDKPVPTNPKSDPCCISAPSAVYGHTGYTGTCCWVDPVNKLVYVFLSNRTYPNDGVNKLARMGIRTKIQEVIYKSIKN